MKTFLPIISPNQNVWQTMRLSLEALDNKRLGKQRVESYQIWRTITGLNKTKSWRTSPAIHMWRGYPQALGVYILINCQIWERRKSATTGKNFSNLKMNEHIRTFNFGKNDSGELVFEMEEEIESDSDGAPSDEEATGKAETDTAAPATAATGSQAESKEPAEGKESSEQPHEHAVTKTHTIVTLPPAAAAASSSQSEAATAAANSSASAAVAATSSSSSDAALAAPKRSGTYVDGIRIPWWWHDERIHRSDAGILYQKDPVFYKHFKAQGQEYKEYVWPRDINPYHPEQKEELNELQAIIDQETAAAEQKKAAKKAAKQAERATKQAKSKDGKEAIADKSEDESDADSDDGQDDAPLAKPRKRTSAAAAAATASAADVAATPIKRTRSARRGAPDIITAPSPADIASMSPAVSRSGSPSLPSAPLKRQASTRAKRTSSDIDPVASDDPAAMAIRDAKVEVESSTAATPLTRKRRKMLAAAGNQDEVAALPASPKSKRALQL